MRHLSIMRHLLLAAAIAASALLPRPAAAQVAVQLRLDLPVVLPGLVIIEPGIQVVPQVNEEVFFVDGYYWVRRDARWYRSHDHRRGWVLVESRGVPPRLVRIPPGHYRRWEPAREDRERDHRERELMRERERHERERRHEREKQERERQREREKHEHQERRDQDRDRDHGHDRDHDRKD
jgi:hypothetical protein